MGVKKIRAARAGRTRSALCRHARRLFAQKGYPEASLDEIVRRAGVTKGALYHHFTDKLQLYRAVVEAIEEELVAGIAAEAAPYKEPWQRLEVMCRAYLDACLRRDVQRVLVLEAPTVLGWKTWCEIDKEYGIATFAECVRDVIAAGVIDDEQLPETLALVLLGALNTGARVIAAAPEPDLARATVGKSIARLLGGLRSSDV